MFVINPDTFLGHVTLFVMAWHLCTRNMYRRHLKIVKFWALFIVFLHHHQIPFCVCVCQILALLQILSSLYSTCWSPTYRYSNQVILEYDPQQTPAGTHYPRGKVLPILCGLGILPAGMSKRGDSDIIIWNVGVKILFILRIGPFYLRQQVKSKYNFLKLSFYCGKLICFQSVYF